MIFFRCDMHPGFTQVLAHQQPYFHYNKLKPFECLIVIYSESEL